MRAEGKGKLMALVLTPGQQHESTVFEPLMGQRAVRRAGRGRPKQRPKRVADDKGYSSRRNRRCCRRRGIRITIPQRQNETRTGPLDRTIYRTRNRVEGMIKRFKRFGNCSVCSVARLGRGLDSSPPPFPCKHLANKRINTNWYKL